MTARDDEIKMLRASLKRHRHRSAITEALHAYAFHIDRNEPEEIGRLFTSDAVVDYGPEMGVIYGRAMLVKSISRGLNELFAATSHHISNVSIDFDGDESARVVAYVYAWHRYRDGSPDGYLWGQYHASLRNADDRWQFTRLKLKLAGSVDFHRNKYHSIGRRLPLSD